MEIKNEFFLADFDRDKKCVTVRLCGEIDHHSAVAIRREIDEMILRDRPEKLILDLGTVDFMDSSGLGLIMGRYSLACELGGRTVIRNAGERTMKILTLAGLDKIITIEKNTKTERNRS